VSTKWVLALKNMKLSRTFSVSDQNWFANFSKDFNPIHVAPLKAGSTHTGDAVVHGMHLVLWLIEEMCKLEKLTAIKSTNVSFIRPCYVGDEVKAVIERRNSGQFHGEVRIGSTVLLELDLSCFLARPLTSGSMAAKGATRKKPRLLLEADLEGDRGLIGLPRTYSSSRRRFPQIYKRLGDAFAPICAGFSQIVGMHVPGYFSLFSGFSLEFSNDCRVVDNQLRYEVIRVDPRFRLVTIAVSCGVAAAGKIRAFWREPAIIQPPMSAIAQIVRGLPYKDKHALVIGGSRGIGEATAKLIAAGGGSVTVTYHSAKREAARVAREITDSGGSCTAMQFDVLGPIAAHLRKLKHAPDAVFFFATPRIFNRRTLAYNQDLFSKFVAYYVVAFANLCDSISSETSSRISIFYPSSTALDEEVPDLIEYAMAKAAGEEFCRLIKSSSSKLRIIDRRLPRIETDQTNSFFPVASQSAAEVMLPILDEVFGRPSNLPVVKA
jgi:acyl dehydratase